MALVNHKRKINNPGKRIYFFGQIFSKEDLFVELVR